MDEATVLSFIPLAHRLAKSTTRKHPHSRDDIRSEADVAVVEACQRGEAKGYDGDRLQNYIIRWVKFRLRDFVNHDTLIPVERRAFKAKVKKLMKAGADETSALENVYTDNGMPILNENIPAAKLNSWDWLVVRDALDALKATPLERFLFNGKREGYTDLQLSERLEASGFTPVDRSRVSSKLRSLISRIRNLLETTE